MILYICEFVALALLTIGLVWYFSHESTPYYVRFLVFTSFLFTFTCFLVLPIDIYETSTQSDMEKGIKLTWTIIYDVSFFLCWLVLPMVQEYEDSGEFTAAGKFKDALKMNGLLIGAILSGATLLIIYLVASNQFTFSQLPNVFAFIVNLFGMCLVCIILGFGFVSFPK